MKKAYVLLLILLVLGCAPDPKPEPETPVSTGDWFAYCTCGHGSERIWRGEYRETREEAEQDCNTHNKDNHCATVEKREAAHDLMMIDLEQL